MNIQRARQLKDDALRAFNWWTIAWFAWTVLSVAGIIVAALAAAWTIPLTLIVYGSGAAALSVHLHKAGDRLKNATHNYFSLWLTRNDKTE